MSIAALLNDENSNESDLNPAQRCRQVFIELAAYIRSNIDPNAMFISWKNDEGFSTMHMDAADKFPKELVKIATFFEGYKANLKESLPRPPLPRPLPLPVDIGARGLVLDDEDDRVLNLVINWENLL